MQAVFFLVVAFLQFGIALYGTQNIRTHFNYYALLVLLVVYGLAYDNFAIAAGGFMPEGDLLKGLNAPRYWVHALFTPGMIVAAFGALRLTGSKFGQSKTWHIVFCIIASALIALGSYVDIIKLSLTPVTEAGLTRYVNAFEFLKGPPLPAVLTIIIVLLFGLALWRNTKFPWLFLGALIMFGAAGVMDTPIVQNIGEIAFTAGLVVTQIFAARRAHL